MKKNYALFLLMSGTMASLAFMRANNTTIEELRGSGMHGLNENGAPVGKTGAPGETTCTECHGGTVQTGFGFNTITVSDVNGPVGNYVPGAVYNVEVSTQSTAVKNGFEIVALKMSDATQAGTVAIIPGSGTKLASVSSVKKYVTHTLAGTAQTSWNFTWTAPATDVGAVRFYLATNQTNDNGSSTGDIIRLSNLNLGSTAGTEEHQSLDLSVGFAASTNQLLVNMTTLSAGKAHLNMVDLSGKTVFNEEIGAVTTGDNQLSVRLPESVPAGIYVAHISVNNVFASKKISIQK